MNQNTVKKELRTRLRHERSQNFTPSNFNVILKSPEIVNATTIASYVSYGVEPSTSEINESLLKAGKKILLPRVNGVDLDWVLWDGDPEKLKVTKNLAEPIGPATQDFSELGAVIVPALHIDKDGYRLGQGGGFYDRALTYLPGWKIGLVHSGELTELTLPRETHDMPLDAAATPSIVVHFKR